jgi:fructose-1,6-bisphosphatase/inositol monophosphatase family enzyme
VTNKEINGPFGAGRAAVLAAGPIALGNSRKPKTVTDNMRGRFCEPVTETDRRIEALIGERLTAQ